jgi:plastocyanin
MLAVARMKRLLPALLLVVLLYAAAPASAEVKTETFRFPVTVKGYQVKQEMTFGVQHPNVDGYITGMSTNVVNADGSPVPIQRLMLHHIVFSNVGQQNPLCPSYRGFDANQTLPGLATPLYGAGEERNILALPPGYGLRLHANDSWLMTWMLMNHRKTKDSAFIEWKVTYTTDPQQEVKLYWLDVENCKADPIFSVPGGGKPGSTYTKTAEITMPESGHVVAAGGHVHGGAYGLDISQPDCENRTIVHVQPAWGTADHPFYHVRPILHEPGPIAMSGTLSSQGFPVAAGQRIRLTATYDNQYPHTRVMGIAGMYVAPSSTPVDGCGPLPSDAATFQTSAPHRSDPPVFKVPITGLDSNGKAVTIQHPPGKTVTLSSGSNIDVKSFFFSRPNVKVKRGAKLTWLFKGAGTDLHNVTLANGPLGFASPNYGTKAKFTYRFNRRGKYQIFCALHPVSMTETVTVK